MASYNTLPVAANPEDVLLQKPKKTSLRYLVGGAALAAFVLGAVAATAVKTSPGLRGSTQLDQCNRQCMTDHDCQPGGFNRCGICQNWIPGAENVCVSGSAPPPTPSPPPIDGIQIRMTADNYMCLAVHDAYKAKKGSPLVVKTCAHEWDAQDDGQLFQVEKNSGDMMQIKTELDGTTYCVTALTGDHKDFRVGDQMGIWSCDAEHNGRKGYPAKQTLEWQEYGDQAISLPYFPEGGCLTAAGNRVIGSKCRGNFPVYRTQQWNLRGHDI